MISQLFQGAGVAAATALVFGRIVTEIIGNYNRKHLFRLLARRGRRAAPHAAEPTGSCQSLNGAPMGGKAPQVAKGTGADFEEFQ